MVTTTTKRLREFLLDPQEPFTLQVYLAERGRWFRSLSLDVTNGCCLMSSSKNSKKLVLPTSKKLSEFAKKLNSVLQKTVSLGDQMIPNKKDSNRVIAKRRSDFDGSVSFESFSGEFPPSDYDHGSSVAEFHETDAKKTAKSQEFTSDLQRAWRLWENSIVNCKKGKAETIGMNHTEPDSVLSNRKRLLMTNRRKMQNWIGTEEQERLQRTIRSKFFLSWRIELKGGLNSKQQAGLNRVNLSEDWNVLPEEHKEIGRVIEDFIMDDIVREMILLFSIA